MSAGQNVQGAGEYSIRWPVDGCGERMPVEALTRSSGRVLSDNAIADI